MQYVTSGWRMFSVKPHCNNRQRRWTTVFSFCQWYWRWLSQVRKRNDACTKTCSKALVKFYVTIFIPFWGIQYKTYLFPAMWIRNILALWRQQLKYFFQYSVSFSRLFCFPGNTHTQNTQPGTSQKHIT